MNFNILRSHCQLSLLTSVAEVVVPRPDVVVIALGELQHQSLEGGCHGVEEGVDGTVDTGEGVGGVGAPRVALVVAHGGVGQGHVQGGHGRGRLGPVGGHPEDLGAAEHGGFLPGGRVVGEGIGSFHNVAAIGACGGGWWWWWWVVGVVGMVVVVVVVGMVVVVVGMEGRSI